jgi:hypothetical protein
MINPADKSQFSRVRGMGGLWLHANDEPSLLGEFLPCFCGNPDPTNKLAQRVPVALQTIFPIASGVGMFFLPDTPRW